MYGGVELQQVFLPVEGSVIPHRTGILYARVGPQHTGNPFVTTDSGAALRALEIGADALLKGTRVDGVYTADPEKDPSAVKYDELTFDKAMEDHLKVMDQTAFALCREGNMPVIVFDMNCKGNLLRLLDGGKVGTLVHV